MLSRLVSWYQSRHSKKFLQFAPLDLLTVELIYEISSWLPVHSSASLALCSHRFYDVLGRETLSSLEVNGPDRTAFFQALDRDLAGTLYCFTYNRLHVFFPEGRTRLRVSRISRRVTNGRCQEPVLRILNDFLTDTIFSERLRFENVQMAANLRRRGLLSQAHKYMAHLSHRKPEVSWFPKPKDLYLFETCFIGSKIYVRAQSWLWFERARKLKTPTTPFKSACVHMDPAWRPGNGYTTAFKCKIHHLSKAQKDCKKCRRLIRCPFCPTEIAMEIKSGPDCLGGAFIVATKWQTLGYGLSPLGDEWKSHIEFKRLPWPYAPDDLPGSIRNMYEAQAKTKYESLLSVNKAKRLLDLAPALVDFRGQ